MRCFNAGIETVTQGTIATTTTNSDGLRQEGRDMFCFLRTTNAWMGTRRSESKTQVGEATSVPSKARYDWAKMVLKSEFYSRRERNRNHDIGY